MCFSDGVLYYSDFAKLIDVNVKKLDGCISMKIFIDACYSGWIVESFKNRSDIALHFSCQKNEVSADLGVNGGWFTTQYFTSYDLGGDSYLKLKFGGAKSVEHEYSDGTKSIQTPGYYRNI